MKNKLSIFFFAAILMCLSLNSFAQKVYDNETPDSITEPPPEYKADDDYSDTVVKRTLLNYENDSLLKWKLSREFSYMPYLDSLLKKRSDIKADTVTIDQTSGKVKHKIRSSDNSGINKFLNSLPIKIFFWALAIFFIGFVFYRIFFKNGIFDGLKKKRRTADADEDLQTGLVEFSEYDALIHAAELNNNFNLSIRYLYLQTLKMLADRGFINFSPDKTNNEYLRKMEAHTYQKQFASLTRNYEYVWYGKFLIDQFQYQRLKNEFIEFNKKV